MVYIEASNKNVLKYAIENGMIDLSYVQEQIEMSKKKELLEKHPYKIWEGKDGKWYTYLPDENKHRKLVKRANQKKIEDVIIEYYSKIEENPLIGNVFEEWNDERFENNEIGKNSYTKYQNDFKRFFHEEDLLCKKPMRDITEADLLSFIKLNIKRYNLSRKTYASLRTIIIGVFKHAKMNKMTNISISTFFSDLQLSNNIFKKNRKEDATQVFNDDEVVKIVSYLEEHPTVHNLGLLLLFETGMRVGELCVLKPCNITKDGILVNSTEIYYKNPETNKTVFEIKDTPKMGADERTIVITEHTRKIIKRIRMLNPFGEYLFMNNGKRINGTRFNYHLYKACREVGVPERSTHKIRKTYASKLIDANVEEAIIRSQLGHTDIKTTKEYYYYATQNQKYKENQISKAIGM